jgi:hypothetical protein
VQAITSSSSHSGHLNAIAGSAGATEAVFDLERLDASKPLVISAGADSLRQIGESAGGGRSHGPVEMVQRGRDEYEKVVPPRAAVHGGGTPGGVGGDPHTAYPEAQIDEKRNQKEEELEK